MIIIDTTIISEMMREESNPQVLAWTQTAGRLHTTVITLAEIDYGIARLPEGRRKDGLSATAAGVFADFHDGILPLDARAARGYATSLYAGRGPVGRSPCQMRRLLRSVPPKKRRWQLVVPRISKPQASASSTHGWDELFAPACAVQQANGRRRRPGVTKST